MTLKSALWRLPWATGEGSGFCQPSWELPITCLDSHSIYYLDFTQMAPQIQLYPVVLNKDMFTGTSERRALGLLKQQGEPEQEGCTEQWDEPCWGPQKPGCQPGLRPHHPRDLGVPIMRLPPIPAQHSMRFFSSWPILLATHSTVLCV